VVVTLDVLAAGTSAAHCTFTGAGQVMAGGVISLVHVTVREVVAVLLQASLAVNVLVCDLVQVPVTDPSLGVTDGEPVQLSAAEAEPSAASISDAEGLQPRVVVVPFAEIVGFV
jgi:hypothetical protein